MRRWRRSRVYRFPAWGNRYRVDAFGVDAFGVFQVKKRNIIFAVLVLGGFFLSGCQTGEVFVTPPLNARILDSRTNLPIENVQATIWSSEQPEARETGLSNKDGVVRLPRLKNKLEMAFPFVSDRVAPPSVVRFEAKGYVSKEMNSDTGYPYFAGTQPVELDPSAILPAASSAHP